MTKKTHDLVVKLGEYQDRNGETKGRWKNIGSVLKMDDGGTCLVLDRTFNPAGVPNPEARDTVLVSVFPVDRDQNAASGATRSAQTRPQASGVAGSRPGARQASGGSESFDDDIPF